MIITLALCQASRLLLYLEGSHGNRSDPYFRYHPARRRTGTWLLAERRREARVRERARRAGRGHHGGWFSDRLAEGRGGGPTHRHRTPPPHPPAPPPVPPPRP